MPQPIKLNLKGMLDRNEEEYYLLVSETPILVDMSKAVFLIHPWEDDEGNFGAQLTIRMNNDELRNHQNDFSKDKNDERQQDGERPYPTRHGKRRSVVD